jgi:CRISPR-associated endonuclease/helicase Cas3
MLTPDQFGRFVDEVHGTGGGDGHPRSPFPWQERLLSRLIRDGRWPDVIDVPTGLGKTSMLDIAVFAAAMGLPPSRRRIFFVVDRRLVVDEAYMHAQRIADALASPGRRPVTSAVARRLTLQSDEGVVLDVTRMRGGATWERVWLDRPDRFAIVTGTVDQVGSRLLFRGYGVSERSRSIDAALVGSDSLIIVDEAHLSHTFLTTVRSALHLDCQSVVPHPIVVSMSATADQVDSSTVVHGIDESDETHDVAGRRLRAPKRLHLVEVKTTKATADREIPAAMARLATSMATGQVVGIVANTVARARAIYELMKDQHETVLLTGRGRSIDRDYLLHRYYPRMKVGRDRQRSDRLVVVATQTVEVGANIDFDVLVTESAPFSSLVQRVGRLNRTADSSSECIGIVVHDSSVGSDDPVYGAARLATWNWLISETPELRYSMSLGLADLGSGLDASPAALRKLQCRCSPSAMTDMRVAQPYVPILHKAILDAWVRTSPAPAVDQPIEPFLHGLDDSAPPVTVVWREALNSDQGSWIRHVDAMPPTAEEGIEVSIQAVRWWLGRRETEAGTTDLDIGSRNTTADDTGELSASSQARVVLRYQERGSSAVIWPREIRPGDTIVVPTSFGGCDRFGWNPQSDAEVVEVSDLALRRGRPTVRLAHAFVRAVEHWDGEASLAVERLVGLADRDLDGEHVTRDQYRRGLQDIRDLLEQTDRLATPLGAVVCALLNARIQPEVIAGSGAASNHEASEDDRTVFLRVRVGQLADDSTALGSSAMATHPIGLAAHEQAVAARAAQFASNIGLSERIIASVSAAARWHDEGKRDPRFQIMLWRGDRARAELADEPLAKSGMDPSDRAAFARARRAAGYPEAMRHEALSALITSRRVAGDPAVDRDLVVHLVASHHGHGRPLLPPVADPAPVEIEVEGVGVFDSGQTIDWTHPRRFDQLNSTYGRWGLALLETIVRLADIWCSVRSEGDKEQAVEPCLSID